MQPLAIAGKSFAFNQSDVSALASAWWDFSDEATLFVDEARTIPVSQNGSIVKGILDKSGNGHHASSATPYIFYRNVKGNKSALKTSVFSNFLTASMPSFPSKRGAILTIFAPGHTSAQVFTTHTFGGAGITWGEYSTVSGANKYAWFDGVGLHNASVFDVTNTWVMKTMHRTGNTLINLRINKTQSDAFNVADNQPADNPLSIFGSSFETSNSYVLQVLLFDDISITDLQKVENYFHQINSLSTTTSNPILVGFGDSITLGYGVATDKNIFINRIGASKLWTVINSGISGTTLQNTVQNSVAAIGGATENNGRDTYATRVNQYNPNYVIVQYGLNDLRLNDAAFTAANFQNNLGEIIDAIIANGTPADHIIIGSPSYVTVASYTQNAPYNGATAQKFTDYRAACSAIATAKSTLYVDIYQAMENAGGDILMQGDGIHTNDAGHAVIANTFLSVL